MQMGVCSLSMTGFPPLVEALLRDESLVLLQQRATEGVLMVDRYGTTEWRFESGRYQVRLDFATKLVTVSEGLRTAATIGLPEFLNRLHVEH